MDLPGRFFLRGRAGNHKGCPYGQESKGGFGKQI
jgi:hypothetical protein